MASWNPFSDGINIFPNQGEQKEFNSAPSQDYDFWKIDLPGGGFIQMPGSQLPPASEGFIQMPGSKLPAPASEGFVQMPGSKLSSPSEGFIKMSGSQLPPTSEAGFIQMAGSQLSLPSEGFIQIPGSKLYSPSEGFIQMPGSQLPPTSEVGFIQMPESQLPPTSESGFIQIPRTQLSPVSDDFTSPEERQLLMEKLDTLLESRADQEERISDLLTEENCLRKCLKQVNDDLDTQSTELCRLTETLRETRNEMLRRVDEKKTRLVDLRELLLDAEKEEKRTSSYRIIASESRALKKRIAEDKEGIKAQQKVMADLKLTKREARIKVKNILEEEKALWMKISEKVQWMAENGYPLVEPGNETNSLTDGQEGNEENPAGSTTLLEQSADAKASYGKDEELAEKDQDPVKDVEEDKPTSLENAPCTESLVKAEVKEKPSQASPISTQIGDEAAEAKPLKMSPASTATETEPVEDEKIRRKIKKEEKKREREEKKREKEDKKKEKKEIKKKEKREKKEKKKKAKEEKRNNVLHAGLQTHDSLTLDPPGGTWADTASVTSTQSVDSAAIPPTIVTVEAEIHQPITKGKQKCVRTNLRPSKKEIAAQLASNREQLKLAGQIEILERLEFKDDEKEKGKGDEETADDNEEEQEREDKEEDEVMAVYLAMLEEEENYEVVDESSVKRGCFSFLRKFFGRFKSGSKNSTPQRQRKSRAARRKAMKTLGEKLAMHAPAELVSGAVLSAQESN